MTLVHHALNYAEHGWSVFPLNGKIPYGGTRGHLDATTDTDAIKAMWGRYPNANIGFALPASLLVLDVDIAHHKGKYGDETLDSLVREHGELPDTLECITGSGGRHIYFTTTKSLSCQNGFLEGLDRKTKGGYVVLPPSIHPETKKEYLWEGGNLPCDTTIAPLPEWLYNLMASSKPQKPLEVAGRVAEGKRNETLFRLASMLRGKGLGVEAIKAALQEENKARCDPPLTAREVKNIAQSMGRYPAGGLVIEAEQSVRPNDFTDTGNARIFAHL